MDKSESEEKIKKIASEIEEQLAAGKMPHTVPDKITDFIEFKRSFVDFMSYSVEKCGTPEAFLYVISEVVHLTLVMAPDRETAEKVIEYATEVGRYIANQGCTNDG